MAERLHPGIYISTQRSGVAPIQAASTSNGGFVGVTRRGPTDVATLVTSFPDFERKFGGFVAGTVVPHHVYAFFANKGARAYVVRTVPSDAVAASGYLESIEKDVLVGTGNGVNKVFSLATLSRIKPSSVQITYKTLGTPVAPATIAVIPAPDGVAGVGAVTAFAGRVLVAGGAKIVPGTVSVVTLVNSPATVTYTDPAANGILKDGAGDARGRIDYKTGYFSISVETGNVPDAGQPVTIGYTPESAAQTITDDGAGNLVNANLASGTVNYTTGAITFTIDVVPAAPAVGNQVLLNYTRYLAQINASSKGDWGNDAVLAISGDQTTFARATASFTGLVVQSAFEGETEETFSPLDMTPTSSKYLPTVLNNEDLGSQVFDVVEPTFTDAFPAQLNGRSRSTVIGMGNDVQLDFGSTDGTGGTASIPVTVRANALTTPVQPGSVVFTYVDVAGATQTITDDGNGNLVGTAIDTSAPASYNVVNYTTGAFAFRVLLANAPQEQESTHGAAPTALTGSSIGASYYGTPEATTVSVATAGGSDGTAVTRSNLTSPTLFADRLGVYALNRFDELMTVVVPDAAGDVAMITDLLAEAERNNRWYIVVAPPVGKTPTGAQEWRRFTLGANSRFGAMYYPYIKVSDPVTNLPLLLAPGGHIAGAYARTDGNKSVGKAPGGTVDGALAWCIGLERKLEWAELDVLHPFQVNALVDTPQTGRAIWGVRSLENPPADFRYIHATRLFEFLDKSIFDATHNQVFENVGPTLWANLKSISEGFLNRVWQAGALKGATAAEAYVVQCDDQNNPENVQENGEVIVDVWAAVNKPGEFIQFRLRQIVNLGA